MDLSTKTLDELKLLASGLGIKVHHLAKEKSIIKQIQAQQSHRIEGVAGSMGIDLDADIPVSEGNTPEQVLEAIQGIMESNPTLKADFPNDGTWVFTCTSRRLSESGNLDIPLRVIKNRAMMLMRPKRGMPILKRDKGDRTYAGQVFSA